MMNNREILKKNFQHAGNKIDLLNRLVTFRAIFFLLYSFEK